MAFFSGANTGTMTGGEAEALEKALNPNTMQAGYGTNSASFVNGRALIPENVESDVMNVMAETKDDCKLIASMKKTMVKSTVHEVIQRESEGDYMHATVPEGGSAAQTGQSLRRRAFEVKYVQTRREVTKQMEVVDTFENAMASETLSGINTVLKASEHLCFHGDSSVVPTEFDGFLAAIQKAPENERCVKSLRGASIGKGGEAIFNDIAQMVFEKGAYLDRALFPPVLSKDIAEIYSDKLRFMVGDKLGFFAELPAYPTPIGAKIQFAGERAGADRFFRVKGKVTAQGDVGKRPPKPKIYNGASGTGARTGVKDTKFTASDKGVYFYTVHAVNAYGVSEAAIFAPNSAEPNTPVGLGIAASEAGVELVIQAGTGNETTGYIICRSKKDGTADETMELTRIAKTGNTTSFLDKNEDLPGTASMLFLSSNKIQPTYTFAQLLPTCKYPLYPTDSAVTPFMIMLFGMLEVRVPKFCGLVKDIGYQGGF